MTRLAQVQGHFEGQIKKKWLKNPRSVFYYYKLPWIFSDILDLFCASEKSLNSWNIRDILKIFYRKSRKSNKNFKDFSRAQINSENSEKIYDYLRQKNLLLGIVSEFLELMCTWEKIKEKNMFLRLESAYLLQKFWKNSQ